MRMKVYVIFAVMLVAIASSWFAWIQERERMETKLCAMRMKLDELAAEHQLAMDTANKALAYRSQVNEEYKLRALELEKALDACPSLDSVLLPDDIRMRIAPDARDSSNDALQSPK